MTNLSLKWPNLTAGSAILLMTLVAYIPAMYGGFIWDDDSYVTNNPLLPAIDGLWRIWFAADTPQYYPLVFTTFWLEHRLWGLNPMGFHIVNVSLHALNAVIVWFILQRLNVRGAWLIGAVFALHPVHVESVAWITERKNVLSGLFYLLALWSYLKFDEAGGKKWYGGALLLFVFALLSKTVTPTFPVVLLILMWYRGKRIGKREIFTLIPFLAIGLVMGLVTVWYEVHHVGAKGEEWGLTVFERILVAGRVIWFYALKLLYPVNLTFIYPVGSWIQVQ